MDGSKVEPLGGACRWGRGCAVVACTALTFLLGAQTPPTAEQAKPAEAPAVPASPYAGTQACQMCHEDIVKAFARNAHYIVEKDKGRGWQDKACESCHGPGAKHAESASATDIVNPSKRKPAEADRNCLQCHLNTPTQAGRIRSGHAKNQVGCTACHSVHKPGLGFGRFAPASRINEGCAGCHASVWAQFMRPYKHRLPEAAMSCVDCHNPHGSLRPRSLQTAHANEPGCFRCHGNLRGPFVWEHAPVKLEGCMSCHEPHGSANPRMLTRHEVRYVCLECHANLPSAATATGTLGGIPPAFHDLRNPRFRNCTICHQKIHGSYVDRTLLR
jgi:DmsE family decaheme c-type cytochrome